MFYHSVALLAFLPYCDQSYARAVSEKFLPLVTVTDLRALLRQKRDGYGASLGISGYGASVGSREGEAYAAGMSPTMIAMLINAINQALAQSATTPAASGGGDNRHLQALIPVHLRTQQH
ncbi:uncharacterized protein LOC129587154 isoform X2 [Paramacrobiotus metropolitanus]|uniref:uncharacterized protein LOC129587154 isoform X2 n=1 Tax=Paramacrobiotus metropolitanus TaxID=2943436 RepID=UPI0024460187|nr:uncharacterized protein LOC129587154 isoform X2 [Paramacrobiotus metropolitanus]